MSSVESRFLASHGYILTQDNGDTLRTRRSTDTPPPTSPPPTLTQTRSALVEQGDKEMALGYAEALSARSLAIRTTQSLPLKEAVRVAPYSTFSQPWSRLDRALSSEPFASFAKAKNIDLSTLLLYPDSQTIRLSGQASEFNAHNTPGWNTLTGDVFAALAELSVDRQHGPIQYFSKDSAPANVVAAFYGETDRYPAAALLGRVGQLLNQGDFDALQPQTSSNSHVDAIRQRQESAKQHLVGLSPEQFSALAPVNEALIPSARTELADQQLARICARELLYLRPEIRPYGQTATNELTDLPERSGFGQAREALKTALSSDAFVQFVRKHSISMSSVSIDPGTGELSGLVNGTHKTFSLHDLSGWSEVGEAIQQAAKRMVGGSTARDITLLISRPRLNKCWASTPSRHWALTCWTYSNRAPPCKTASRDPPRNHLIARPWPRQWPLLTKLAPRPTPRWCKPWQKPPISRPTHRCRCLPCRRWGNG